MAFLRGRGKRRGPPQQKTPRAAKASAADTASGDRGYEKTGQALPIDGPAPALPDRAINRS
jgi:hypothetical protein